MTTAPGGEAARPVVTHVVVAAQARADASRLIREASVLVHALRAELVGLFVEEAELLRVAALPLTREVGAVSGAVRALELQDTIRLLERQAAEVRRLVAQAASSLDVPWSFRVARGDVIETALSAAAGPDRVLLAPPPSALHRVLGLAPAPPPVQGRVAALFDATDAGERALAAALDLAEGRAESVALVVTQPAEAERLRRLAAERLGPATVLPPAVVLRDLRGRPPLRALVISTGELSGAAGELRTLLVAANCPVVLVR